MKKLDLTYPLDNAAFEAMAALAPKDKILSKIHLFGHIGTHLDLMGKDYPDSYYAVSGRVFDVRHVRGRDIDVRDINFSLIREKDFVFFNSGCLSSFPYGSKEYIFAPVQLSWELITALINKKAAMIGVDFAGVRLPGEHPRADSLCADAGVFNVENVYGLEDLVTAAGDESFTVRSYPMRLVQATGLPCRIIAEI